MPKCLGAEVSCGRSVRLPAEARAPHPTFKVFPVHFFWQPHEVWHVWLPTAGTRFLIPSTHRRRRRDSTVELRRVGGVYWAYTPIIKV